MQPTDSSINDDPPAEDGLTAVAVKFLRWRNGEAAALESLVRDFSGSLWHVARAYGLDASTAEDVVQLTWLAFIRRADSIREPAAVPGWLTTTVRREAARLAQTRSREVSQPDELIPVQTEPGARTLEDVVVDSMDSRVLWRHVSELSERCQRLLRVIAFAHNPDYRALSSELGMPVGGIGPTRRRCLDKLRLSLSGDPAWSQR